jgi:hypothetical protein
MNVTVCRLYKNGRPDKSIKEAIPGDLNLGRLYHAGFSRDVTMLHLISDNRGGQFTEPLVDAFCYQIAASVMWWRGFEIGAMGQQVAQEWFVKPAQ